MNTLKNIYQQIIEDDICKELDWNDYEFGKNFYQNVVRDNNQTFLESEFIINKLRLKNNQKVLDLGCGGGRNALFLADKGFKVTGIDLNLYAIEQANISNKQNCNFIHGNILDIDYKNEFDSVIIIFNHFSNFTISQAQSLLSKIEKSLVSEGKILIEISSESFLKSLDNSQEWEFTDSWLSGNFKQLVLVENEIDNKKNIHIRKDHCININDLSYSRFIQKSQGYSPEKINYMLKKANLKLTQIYGDWQGKVFEEDDNYMIITAQKL